MLFNDLLTFCFTSVTWTKVSKNKPRQFLRIDLYGWPTVEASNWSTRPTTVPAGSDHYFHTVRLSIRLSIRPYIRHKTSKSSDNHCLLGLWAGQVDHWWLLSCDHYIHVCCTLILTIHNQAKHPNINCRQVGWPSRSLMTHVLFPFQMKISLLFCGFEVHTNKPIYFLPLRNGPDGLWKLMDGWMDTLCETNDYLFVGGLMGQKSSNTRDALQSSYLLLHTCRLLCILNLWILTHQATAE